MSWEIEGASFETCSCDVVGPCTASLALGADYDRRRVTLVFHVTSGDVDGADVSGPMVAAVTDTPKVMSDGNWRLGVFIATGAAEKLGAVQPTDRRADAGARSARIRDLGVERAPIEVREEGLYHSVTIGDTPSTSRSRTSSRSAWRRASRRGSAAFFHPAGCELTVAKATRSSIDPFGIRYEGKAAFSSSHFTWAA